MNKKVWIIIYLKCITILYHLIQYELQYTVNKIQYQYDLEVR